MVTCRRCRRRLNRAAGGPWPPCWRWPCSPPGLPWRRCPALRRRRSAWSPAKRQPITQIDRVYRAASRRPTASTWRRASRPILDEVLFTEGRGGQEGRSAVPAGAGAVPRRRPGQGGAGRAVQGAAAERPGRARPQPERCSRRRPASKPPSTSRSPTSRRCRRRSWAPRRSSSRRSINLDYTEIRAPIDGKIGRTAVTAGNYVSPSTGTLVSIVSQDPMYVVFPVPTRTVIELQRAQRRARRSDLRHPHPPARRQPVRPDRARSTSSTIR